MLEYLPNEPIFLVAGAFLLGLLLGTVFGRRSPGSPSNKQDPRDARIRAFEAELRIAKADSTDSKAALEKAQEELNETVIGLERRDNVISQQQSKIEKHLSDLKSSVAKTHQLRAELADRAEQGVHAQAKIREVETELSVAQASTDMIATGVLDYSLSPNGTTAADLSLEEVDPPKDRSKTSR
jgi:multidrug resistance efflux pump